MMQLMMPLNVSMITIKARTLKNKFRFTFGIDSGDIFGNKWVKFPENPEFF